MNHRLYELFVRAGGQFDHYGEPILSDIEVFAELIVHQILDITDAHTEVFQTDRDKAVIEHIKQSVKTHFGVE